MPSLVRKHPEGFDLFGTARLRESQEDFKSLFSLILKSHEPTAELYSQFGQDVFALLTSGFKREGFFVEFGATDGIGLSNSYTLEKFFDWHGILAEPGRNWQCDLKLNRSATIVTDCVWSTSGETIEFLESLEPALSTALKYESADGRNRKKKKADSYEVNTISLNDLLASNGAPSHVDYLSIDTEGSELEILQALDFDKYSFGVITCEHNYTDARQKICDLLQSKGYERKLIGASQCDDWYVNSNTRP